MAGLELIRTLVDGDHGLATLATTRADGTVSSNVVNAGVVDHPLTAMPVVGVVARGDSGKLRHLRARPHGAVNFHDDWETYDRVMAEERRTAVLMTPERVYSNR